jgi:hypothetical protein
MRTSADPFKIVKKTHGISLKLTSLASFSANCPGPDNIAFMVPEVSACSRFTINSWPSDEISLTYKAFGPSIFDLKYRDFKLKIKHNYSDKQ